MKRVFTEAAGIALATTLGLGFPGSASAQMNLIQCTGLWFSTSEDFRSGVDQPGGPIISDGDLLTYEVGSGARLCARNTDLLRRFDVNNFDHGLDALDQVQLDEGVVIAALSTEIDSVNSAAQFTAGDLIFTTGPIVPNGALLAAFGLPRSLNLGLDAVTIEGSPDEKRRLLAVLDNTSPDEFRDNPERLVEILEETNTDILFSTEGTPPDVQQPLFLDGDLLSARNGTIVRANADLLSLLPAGLPARGVDYGLDAYTPAVNPLELVPIEIFSIEVQAGERVFSDGDALLPDPVLYLQAPELIKAFEPRDFDMGLDALAAPTVRVGNCPFRITNVSDIPVGDIDQITGYFDTDRPFGRDIRLQGNLPGLGCPRYSTHEYRIRVSVDGALPVTVLHPASQGWLRDVQPTCDGNDLYESDTQSGWFTLTDYARFGDCPDDASLAIYRSASEAGATAMFAEFWIEMQPIGGGGPVVPSGRVRIRLDNAAPDPVDMALFQPGSAVAFDDQCNIDGMGADVVIDIRGEIEDAHFSHYTLTWNGDGNVGGAIPTTVPRAYNSPPLLDDTGTVPDGTMVELGTLNLTQQWDLELDGVINGDLLPQCGYSITLTAVDRAHNGSMRFGLNSYGAAPPNSDTYQQSFCVVP